MDEDVDEDVDVSTTAVELGADLELHTGVRHGVVASLDASPTLAITALDFRCRFAPSPASRASSSEAAEDLFADLAHRRETLHHGDEGIEELSHALDQLFGGSDVG